jgi:adenylosuccinate lyase
VREVEEPFKEGQKGSSAMPHKRNPIVSERITGLARVLRGNAQTGLENVALWHERDISHSSAERVVLPDSTTLLDYVNNLAIRVVGGMRVYPERMRENLELTYGAIFSQGVLSALVEGGLTRDAAYRIVQRAAQTAWDERRSFRKLLEEDEQVTGRLDSATLDELFDYGRFLRNVPSVFERLDVLATA